MSSIANVEAISFNSTVPSDCGRALLIAVRQTISPDQRYTNHFADDRFHSRKAKRLPQTQKWQQCFRLQRGVQSATGRIRGGELGRTVAAATGRTRNTMFIVSFFRTI